MKPATEKKRKIVKCGDCNITKVSVDDSSWKKILRRLGWTVSCGEDGDEEIQCINCRLEALENRVRSLEGFASGYEV